MASQLTPVLLSSLSARELLRLLPSRPREVLEQLLELEQTREPTRRGVLRAVRLEIKRRKARPAAGPGDGHGPRTSRQRAV
jgi:hypothetical protein